MNLEKADVDPVKSSDIPNENNAIIPEETPTDTLRIPSSKKGKKGETSS